jgi:hypothetical protein
MVTALVVTPALETGEARATSGLANAKAATAIRFRNMYFSIRCEHSHGISARVNASP